MARKHENLSPKNATERSNERRESAWRVFLDESGFSSPWRVSVRKKLDSGSVPSPDWLPDETVAEHAKGAWKRELKRYKRAGQYLVVLIRQLLFASIIGLFAGLLGVAFQFSMREASEFFLACEKNSDGGLFRVVFLLPLSGLVVVFFYKAAKFRIDAGTNQVVEALVSWKKTPLRLLMLAPLIFVSSTITQCFGGSAGREGAALQLGGCVGLGIGRLLRLNGNPLHITIICGMAGGFAAVFGAPLTAAVFALEIARVGVVYYPAFLPAIVSAAIGAALASTFGFPPFHVVLPVFPADSASLFARVLLFGVCAGGVCVFFCATIRRVARALTRFLPNEYWRILFGGTCVALATVALGTNAYNGTGFANIQAAFDGETLPQDFIFKTFFTAFTLGAGFKGGEIVPALATGALFGGTLAPYLALDPSLGVALGMIAVFCGVTNCPLAALVLSVELFGAEDALIFAIVCGVSYLTSGASGLYKSQRLVFSKLTSDPLRPEWRKALEVEWDDSNART